jgi:hypothetical protein
MQRAARLVLALPALVALAVTGCSAPPTPPPSSLQEPTGLPAPSLPATSAAPSSGAPLPSPTWTELDDAPLARLEMATAAHGGRIWLVGGLSALGEAVNEVEVLDPEAGAWSSGPALPTGLHHAALVSDGDRLILIGGYIGSSFNEPTDLVLTLADGADTWEPGPRLPQPRGAGAAAWDGSRVVFAGGVGLGGVSGDVFALTGGAWSRIGAMARTREHLAAASDGVGRTWLLGGRIGGLDANLADVDLVSGTAITPLDPLPTRRGGVAAFFLPSIGACLTGGEAVEGALATVECSRPDGTIGTLPPMLVPRHGHGAAVVGARAYVLLGGPTPGLSTQTSVERLEVGG